MTQTLPLSLPLPSFSDKRLVELDWLRVLVFGLLIFYHVGMLYAEGWGWHYKTVIAVNFLPISCCGRTNGVCHCYF